MLMSVENKAMISVEEALDKILSFADPLGAEEKPISDSLGQVLAQDIEANFDVPPLDNSAMDGFALQFASIRGASWQKPKLLKVIGEVAAGSMTDHVVTLGAAVRIMTGAPVPPGADSVVPFEDTDEAEHEKRVTGLTEIAVRREIRPGANIRRAGEDIKKGTVVLKKGRVLGPADIGILASLGRTTVCVFRRPVVAILATGNELVDIGQPLAPGKIYNTNSYSLAAQTRRCGGISRLLGVAPDSYAFLAEAIKKGLESDLIITSGGVSVGDYDIVKEVLAREGEISFWTVRMKPGKPLAFGFFQDKKGRKIPHLGLPGNPVSSMITFELFARPLILKMMGKTNLARLTVKATLRNPIKNSDGRRIFARVRVEREGDAYFAEITGEQGSGILMSMVQANGLAVIPEEVALARPGDVVSVIMLDNDEIPC